MGLELAYFIISIFAAWQHPDKSIFAAAVRLAARGLGRRRVFVRGDELKLSNGGFFALLSGHG